MIIGLVAFLLPSDAVLKEANLDTTLYILRNELTNYHLDLEKQNKGVKKQQVEIANEMRTIYEQSNEISLMLYSQKNGYIFDMAYACSQATELYHHFRKKSMPFRRIINQNDHEVARFDSLITNLTSMPAAFLSPQEKTNRDVSITLAVNIRRQLKEGQDQMKEYVRWYSIAEQRLKSLNNYAIKRYADIQSQIFNNKGDNYIKILFNLGENLRDMKSSVVEKYKPVGKINQMPISQWDVRVIFMLFAMIGVFLFVSIFINILTIRIFVTHLVKLGKFASIKETFMAKRSCIMMAMTIVTFAFILGILRFVVNSNFLIMSSGLLVEYAWLQGVILLSLLLRVSGEQIRSAFRIYTPLLVVTFIVIAFRIVLIPNDLITLVFPPILLTCMIWQADVIRRHRHRVPKSDMAYAYISLMVFIVSAVASWFGYTLFSVLALIWWIMQLTCILTLTCIRDWLNVYSEKHEFVNKDITKTWFHKMVLKMILPILGVLSILVSIYWSAEVFNLSDTTWMIFTEHFVDLKQISFSLFNILQVIILYFIFKYINTTLDEFMQLHFQRKDPTTAASKHIMSKNVFQVLIWGVWMLVSISICNISYTWFVVISGGLSTGIGFAMKDILENIYYGISLMAGRIKIGDYIICDGVRGRVSSISYTSTMLEAIDGSVIAFQNSQLFTKNYKNMTKNHGYELDVLDVGVAYGTNISKVKSLLVEGLMKLDCIYQEKGVKVVLKSFDDSCITLKVLVWVNVLTQYGDDGKIMETIYDIFNENNIEIPFPQREVTIKQEKDKPAASELTEVQKEAIRQSDPDENISPVETKPIDEDLEGIECSGIGDE